MVSKDRSRQGGKGVKVQVQVQIRHTSMSRHAFGVSDSNSVDERDGSVGPQESNGACVCDAASVFGAWQKRQKPVSQVLCKTKARKRQLLNGLARRRSSGCKCASGRDKYAETAAGVRDVCVAC